MIVADNLNFGVVSYVLENNASFDVTYEFIGIDTHQRPSRLAKPHSPPSRPTARRGTVVWSIGDVVTTDGERSLRLTRITPSIRINYFARINNDLVTDASDVLRNSVDVTYRNGETGAPQTIDLCRRVRSPRSSRC